MVKYLPYEVLEGILVRLSVKLLKRFRCVSKPWCYLIDSEEFVKFHLHRSLETNSRRHLIVEGEKGQFYDVDLDKVTSAVIKPPLSSVDAISNCCNGWFVVSGESLVMWNPFTRECRTLPRIKDDKFPVPSGCYSKMVCGIVWDSKNDDYKVVGILEHRTKESSTVVASEAHIFGLKSNAWRRTVKFRYPVKDFHTDVNGAFHSSIFDFSLSEQPYQIKAFSVERERHYEVGLPPLGDIWKDGAVSMFVHKLGGCLALNFSSDTEIAVWLMKHYGVSGSWMKLLTIPKKPIMRGMNDSMQPLVYSCDGHKVLVCFGHRTLFWQDVGNQVVEGFSAKGLPRQMKHVDACVETLVSFHNRPVRKQVNNQGKKKGKKEFKEKDKKEFKEKRNAFLSMGFKLAF